MNEEGMSGAGKRFGTRKIWLAATAGIVIVGMAIFFLLRSNSSQLPPAVQQATFPAYYPTDLPGSFAVDRNRTTYDAATGILFIPLNNTYNHGITVTQQAMPGKLTFDSLKGEGDLIDGIEGRAVVNEIEGRVVATMIGKENQTLILINTTTATKEEVRGIVRSLHPVQR